MLATARLSVIYTYKYVQASIEPPPTVPDEGRRASAPRARVAAVRRRKKGSGHVNGGVAVESGSRVHR